jgi:hypothetical protein
MIRYQILVIVMKSKKTVWLHNIKKKIRKFERENLSHSSDMFRRTM